MSNAHQDKYVTKLLIGIGLISASVFLLFFSIIERGEKDNWYLWCLGCIVGLNSGIILISSAYVHKTKSDLIRRQKKREQSKPAVQD